MARAFIMLARTLFLVAAENFALDALDAREWSNSRQLAQRVHEISGIGNYTMFDERRRLRARNSSEYLDVKSTSSEHDIDHADELQGTEDLASEKIAERKVFFGAIIASALLLLSIGGVGAFKYRKWKKDRAEKEKAEYLEKMRLQELAQRGGAQAQQDQHKNTQDGRGGYRKLPNDVKDAGGGLGALNEEELEEGLEEQIAEWAQKHAAKVRQEQEAYLHLRWWIVVFCFLCYVGVSIGLPLAHASEASCKRGFFWETHMQFLAAFVLTKGVELWLCATDATLEFDMSVLQFCIKFFPSFIGYFDGYSDSNAIVIAHSCPHAFAQNLAKWMGGCYIVGVIGLQWIVLFYFAARDPSQACLLKLVHMDLIASCTTLPPEQKWVWDMLAVARTVGEDVPQAILQLLYFLFVKRNYFMLLSIALGVASSLKALHDARSRILAAASAADFEHREQRTTLYSASQDGTIRVWDTRTRECTKTIEVGSPANTISAARGMLYSSHDDGLAREWDLSTGEAVREFSHPGWGEIFATSTHAFTSYKMGSNTTVKVWNLGQSSPEAAREFLVGESWRVRVYAQGDRIFSLAPGKPQDVAEWLLEGGDVVRSYVGHKGNVNALYASKKRLFSGSKDGTVKEWARETATCTRTFSDHATHDHSAIFVLKDKLYNSSQDAINEWSLATGELLRRLEQ